MKASDWETYQDPRLMIDYLVAMNSAVGVGESPYPVPKTSERKFRLIACACLPERQVEPCRDKLELWAETGHTEGDEFLLLNMVDLSVAQLPGDIPPGLKADVIREIVGNPLRPVTLPPGPKCAACKGTGERLLRDEWPQVAGPKDRRRAHCSVCNMTGYAPCPWLNQQVVSLAEAAYQYRERAVPCRECRGNGSVPEGGIYASRHDRVECWPCDSKGIITINNGTLDPIRLAILADALEEAGCGGLSCNWCSGLGRLTVDLRPHGGPEFDSGKLYVIKPPDKIDMECSACGGSGVARDEILDHLRGPGPHYRGCWVVDCVLGKH